MSDKECRSCKYFDLEVYEEGDTWGWCCRYPPTYVGPQYDRCGLGPNSTDYWEQPTVGICGWCGEYEPRNDKPKRRKERKSGRKRVRR